MLNKKILLIITVLLIISCCCGYPSTTATKPFTNYKPTETVKPKKTVKPTVKPKKTTIYRNVDGGLDLKYENDIWYFKLVENDNWQEYPILSTLHQLSENSWVATFKDGSADTYIKIEGKRVITKSTNYPENIFEEVVK